MIFVVPPEHRRLEEIRRPLRATFNGPIRLRPTAFTALAGRPGPDWDERD